jgi:hypothetical protein
MQRRHFLQTGSAMGAMGLVSGCATMGGGSGPKVVVIGGGYAGATAAKYLRMWSEHKIQVTLVEPSDAFISCPMSNLVIGGSKTITEITTPYDNLTKRHGVKIIKDRVNTIDADKRVVKLAGGTELTYDRLIVSPGVDFMCASNSKPCPTVASSPCPSRWPHTDALLVPTSGLAKWPTTSPKPSPKARC